jgi:hypothetical protein
LRRAASWGFVTVIGILSTIRDIGIKQFWPISMSLILPGLAKARRLCRRVQALVPADSMTTYRYSQPGRRRAMRLVRKHGEHDEEHVDTNAWMMSYADMATTLLAMFIVLSTLGKDQTGVALYNGTGSFAHATDSFGLPGLFPNSDRMISRDQPGPRYAAPSGKEGDGGTDESRRIIDAEEEQFQLFLKEMERQFRIARLPRTGGTAVVDFYERIGKEPPYLTERQADVLWQVLPVLHRTDYQVQIVVWATMPSTAAWSKAATQAQLLADEIAAKANLDDASRSRLFALGQPWRYPNYQRPVMSVVIIKTEPAR